jgi:predicted cobalt transporter CbtA
MCFQASACVCSVLQSTPAVLCRLVPLLLWCVQFVLLCCSLVLAACMQSMRQGLCWGILSWLQLILEPLSLE